MSKQVESEQNNNCPNHAHSLPCPSQKMLSTERYLSFIMDTPHISDIIFSALSPHSIIQCSWTSPLMLEATNNYKKRAYNIDTHLTQFFADPTAFRSLQRQTGTLISGSNALQFFDRTSYPGSDLDLYVVQGHAAEVGHWLMEAEAYEYTPHMGQRQDLDHALAFAIQMGPPDATPHEIYHNRGVIGVFNFKKDKFPDIQVVCTSVSPIQTILSFYSSK